jgi:hypothetical protein
MKLSKILSYILHPIFMPIIVMYVALNYVEYYMLIFENYQAPLYISLSIFTIIFPIIVSIIFVKTNKVESLKMNIREERGGPILSFIFIMIIGFPIFIRIAQLSSFLTAMYVSTIVILAFAYFISKKWKISLHMMGIGGATGSFIALNYIFGGLYYWVICFITLSGLLAFSRLDLKAHNRPQVYAGFILGSLLQSIIIINYNSIISTISIFRSSIASLL